MRKLVMAMLVVSTIAFVSGCGKKEKSDAGKKAPAAAEKAAEKAVDKADAAADKK